MMDDSTEARSTDANKAGIMVFSAAGYVGSTGVGYFNMALIKNKDNTNRCPDFQVLLRLVMGMQDRLGTG